MDVLSYSAADCMYSGLVAEPALDGALSTMLPPRKGQKGQLILLGFLDLCPLSLSGLMAQGWAAVTQIAVLHRSQLSAILVAVPTFSSVHSSMSLTGEEIKEMENQKNLDDGDEKVLDAGKNLNRVFSNPKTASSFSMGWFGCSCNESCEIHRPAKLQTNDVCCYMVWGVLILPSVFLRLTQK